MNDPAPDRPVLVHPGPSEDPTKRRSVHRRGDLIAVGILVVATAALWWIRRRGPAWSMEEAMMLQAPGRVLDGSVPGRDFDWFYGPLSLLIPAGVYRIGAATLVVERAIGAGYVVLVASALYFIGRRWGFAVGLTMGLVAVGIGGLSMTALPIMGAIAGLVGVVAFAVADTSPRTRAITSGLAGAFAVGLRPDFLVFVAVVLGVLTLIRSVRPLAWIALGVGLVPYVWLVFAAGLGTTWRNLVTDAAHVASERHLPWHADLGGTGIMPILGAVVALAAIGLGARRRDPQGVGLLGLGIVGVCLVPEYLQRADGVHVVYVTMVPLATMVPVCYELLGWSDRIAGRTRWRQVGAIAVAVAVLVGLRPKFVARATFRDARSYLTGTNVYPANHDGNVWYFADAGTARAHEELARAASEEFAPGSVLFVGPVALDRPNYTDGSFYTLLPGFTQRTHFYDFHPRIAHVDGARLAADVAAADAVILCRIGLDESNLSSRPGSRLAGEVVEQRFEPIAEAGNCRLYRRIDDGGA